MGFFSHLDHDSDIFFTIISILFSRLGLIQLIISYMFSKVTTNIKVEMCVFFITNYFAHSFFFIHFLKIYNVFHTYRNWMDIIKNFLYKSM